MREPAAETLLEHAEFLRAVARSILHDDHAAEDVAQEALLAAARRPSVRAWLGAVARNLALSRLRADLRRARREHAAARPEAHGDVPEAVARLEAQQRVVEAVLALEPPYRAVVLERFFYERPLPEVAERLGVPVATARTRLRRALATLKARLERRMGPAAMVAALSLVARPAGAVAVTGAALMSTKSKVTLVLVLVLLVAAVWRTASRASSAGGARRVAAGGAVEAASDAPAAGAPDTRAAPPAPRLKGRCVDLRGGAPLGDVRVRVGDDEARSDALGRFAVPWLEESPAPALVASKEGYADAIASVPRERGDADVGDVLLRPLLRLSGVVLTPEDAPAARATVILCGDGEVDGRAGVSTTADEAGRFSLLVPDRVSAPGPVRDLAAVHVAAYLPGFVEGREAVGDPDAEILVRLGPARTVRGVVVDEDTGEGVAGAELFVEPLRVVAPFRGEGWRAGVSGPDGSFEVAVHPLPEHHIVPGMEVRAQGYAPRRLAPAEISADGNRIALAPAATVHGRVTRGDGTPARGVQVTSIRLTYRQPPSSPRMAEMERRWLQGRDPPRFDILFPNCTTTLTGADGEFAVEVPRTPPFRISATAWPLQAEADLTALPEEPVTLVLGFREEYHGLVRVRVVDPARHPIAGASVTWWAVPGAAGSGMSGRAPAADARTDADGHAEVWTNPTWTRPVLFVAWATGWFGVSRDPVDRQRMTGPAEVVCEPAGTVCGRVVGGPLHHGARASLWWRVGGETPWRIQLVRVATDGRFALPGAPPGRSLLVVADPRGRSLLREVDVPADALLDLGDVALEAPAPVRGVVRTAAGEPDAGAWLWWEPKDPYYRQVFVDPYWDRVKADAAGAFELPVWVQGPVHVQAQGAPFVIAPEGVPQAGMPFPLGGVASAEYRPGDGPLTLVTGRR